MMMKFPLVFVGLVVVLAVAGISQAYIPPAGKCKPIPPSSVDNAGYLRYQYWRALYLPGDKAFSEFEADYETYVGILPPNAVTGYHVMRRKDQSLRAYAYTYAYVSANLYYEDVVRDDGQQQRFKIYILDYIPGKMTSLYYRCSDTGELDTDTRFISAPREFTLTAEEKQRLLSKDRSYNFTGGLRKLVNPTL